MSGWCGGAVRPTSFGGTLQGGGLRGPGLPAAPLATCPGRCSGPPARAGRISTKRCFLWLGLFAPWPGEPTYEGHVVSPPPPPEPPWLGGPRVLLSSEASWGWRVCTDPLGRARLGVAVRVSCLWKALSWRQGGREGLLSGREGGWRPLTFAVCPLPPPPQASAGFPYPSFHSVSRGLCTRCTSCSWMQL